MLLIFGNKFYLYIIVALNRVYEVNITKKTTRKTRKVKNKTKGTRINKYIMANGIHTLHTNTFYINTHMYMHIYFIIKTSKTNC